MEERPRRKKDKTERRKEIGRKERRKAGGNERESGHLRVCRLLQGAGGR